MHVRNEDYWREGANVDEIEITAITDKVARTSALLSGDIDLMQALDPKAIKQIEGSPGAGYLVGCVRRLFRYLPDDHVVAG